MSDLEEYIAERKKRDVEFAEDFEIGLLMALLKYGVDLFARVPSPSCPWSLLPTV